MADKSFEQQVSEELSVLRMKPAATVWPAVEAALHKEKKRRWLIWFFLLAACAGASFLGYYYFNGNNQEKNITSTEQLNTISKETLAENKKAKDASSITADVWVSEKVKKSGWDDVPVLNKTGRYSFRSNLSLTPKKLDIALDTGKQIVFGPDAKGQLTVIINKRGGHDTYDHPETKDNRIITGKAITYLNQFAYPKEQPKTVTEPITNNELQVKGKKELDKHTSVTKQAMIPKDTASLSIDNDEKAKQAEKVTEINNPESNAVPPTVIKNSKRNKWQWNIAVDAGSSGLRKAFSLGSLNGGLAFATAPSAPINAIPAPLVSVEPTIKDAFSFGFQLQATRQLGEKHRFGFSAGYSLLQSSMSIGRRVDSAYNSSSNSAFSNITRSTYSSYYYTSTDSTSYKNKYHFIRLGTDLYTPFRLFKKMALQWQVGIGVNILAATNGLHYDPLEKKLFSNNALYTKTQSYISTGIDLSIGKIPFLYIGPHWQYSFAKQTDLTGQPGDRQHFFLSSIRASFVLPKKKK